MNGSPNSKFKNNQTGPLPDQTEAARSQIDKGFESKLRQKRRRKKKIRRNQGILILTLLLVIGLFFFSPLFKIKTVTIRGVYNGDLKAVEQKAQEQVGDHYLFYGKNEIMAALVKNPYVESVEVQAHINGEMEIQVHEFTADYTLVHNGVIFTLNRNGKVLGIGQSKLAGTTDLIDDTSVLPPGNTMYGDGPKKTVMATFRKLMDQNTSTIEFEQLNIQDPADITLEYQGWTVEVGSGEDFQRKINQAINILKSVDLQDEGEIIDMKFDAPPVIRPKGGA